MGYQQQEKRDTSFKHVSNIQHTKADRGAENELFESRHPIFSNNLISETPGISQDGQLDTKTLRYRKWTPATTLADGTTDLSTLELKLEALYSGSFVTTYQDAGGSNQSGERPSGDANYLNDFRYVEKVAIPLIMEQDSIQQYFIAMDWTDIREKNGDVSQDANTNLLNAPTYPIQAQPLPIIQRDSLRLKNWLYKQGFGADYAEKVYESNSNRSEPNESTSGEIKISGKSNDANDSDVFYGGRIFDPAAGTIQIGVNDTDTVQLKKGEGTDLKLPLWIVGYRYVGPTGAAASTGETTGTSGTAASPGITTTIITDSSTTFPLERDVYERNSLQPTDSNDVLEFNKHNDGIFLSASIGDPDFRYRYGSSSYYGESGSFCGPYRYYGSNFVKSVYPLDFSRGGQIQYNSASGHAPADVDPSIPINNRNDIHNSSIILRQVNADGTIADFPMDADKTFANVFDSLPQTEMQTATNFLIDFKFASESIDSSGNAVSTLNPFGPDNKSYARSVYKLEAATSTFNALGGDAAGGGKIQISGSNDTTYSFHALANGTGTTEYAQQWRPIFSTAINTTISTEFTNPDEYKILRIRVKMDDPSELVLLKSLKLYDQFNTTTRFADTAVIDTAYNGGDLFAYTTRSATTPESLPDLSNFGHFEPPSLGISTTHSFHFSEPKRFANIGLYYSHLTASLPTLGDPLPWIDGMELYASTDNTTFIQIASASNIDADTRNGVITSSFYQHKGPYLPDYDNQLAGIVGVNRDNGQSGLHIAFVTASIATGSKYSYYKLVVSGSQYSTFANNGAQYLHGVELIADKGLGPNNRKQIHIGLNDTDTGTVGPFNDGLSVFDREVSASAARLGMFSGSVVGDEFSLFAGGVLEDNISMGYEHSLQQINSITASVASSSRVITEDITATNITASCISASTDMYAKDVYADNVYASESIQLPSLKPIYFTNRTQDGGYGVDEFSARMFGYYTPAGVSEVYLDAYRIYNVSDAKIDLRTLHPTSGSISLRATEIAISGSLIVGSNGANVSIGTVSASAGSNQITGSGTTFITDVNPGDAIRIQSGTFFDTYTVDSVNSDTDLRLTSNWDGDTWTGSIAYVDPDLFTVKNSAGITEFKIGKSGGISASAAISASNIHLSAGSILEVGEGTSRSSVRSGQISAPTVIASSPQGLTTTAITASGNISASGTIIGSNLSGINTGDQSLVHLAVTSSNVLFGNITASNNVSASGTIIANNITAVGIIQAEHFTSTDDAFIADKLTVAGNISSSAFIVDNQTALDTSGTTGRIFVNSTTDTVDIGKAGALTSIILRSNVTASNNVSASGTIIGSNLSGTNTGDQDLSTYIQNSQTASFVTTTTVIDGGSF